MTDPMALRARPLLIWISLTVAGAAVGSWVTGLHRTVVCTIGPEIGMVECPPTDDELAGLAVARLDAAEKSLTMLSTEEARAKEAIQAAITTAEKATAHHENVLKAVREAEDRLAEAERRLTTVSTCDPTEPAGQQDRSDAVRAAQAELERLRTELAAARVRSSCIRLPIELEARSRTRPSVSLHSRERRFRRTVDAETAQREAACRDAQATSPYIFADPSTRAENLRTEKELIASLEQQEAVARRRLDEARVDLSLHDVAGRTASQCKELKATLTVADARAEVDSNRTSLTGMRSVLEKSSADAVAAGLQVDRAKAARTAISERRTAACRDLTEAAGQLEQLRRAQTAAEARHIAANHCKD